MKKITIVLFCGLFSSAIFAQEQQEQQRQQDFNRWSIELEAGVHWVAEPYAMGYYSSLPSFFQGSLGVRYMLSNRFGLKVDVGYANIEAGEGEDGQLNSQPFQTRYLRTSLQGVINAGDILNFRSWTNTFNLLFHGGGGYSQYTYQEGEANVSVPNDADQMYHVMAGITPQIKLSDHIVFTLDATFIGNLHQSSTIDGTERFAAEGFDGLMVNGSAGLTFYLGSAEQHADWYTGVKTTTLDSLEQVITAMKDQMLDSDQDGVANYLDQEPNTVNGVAVNTKGIAVDKNDNNIPDELEYELDERYITNAEMRKMKDSGLITDLLNKGYVNVYFNFNSTEPTEYSLNAINYLITYMSENPSAEAELIGYADEIGNVEYNQELSLARAQKVEDIMEAAGIDPERLTVTGNGEDDSVEKSSQQARQLVRRVTFRLK